MLKQVADLPASYNKQQHLTLHNTSHYPLILHSIIILWKKYF